MATQWSDHFASSQPGLTRDTQRRVSAGVGHARLRYKRAEVTLDLAPDDWGIGDVARLMQFHSSDRLINIYVTTLGTATACSGNLGFYESGVSHDGAVLDVDLFSTLVLSTAIARVDELSAGALETLDRGKTLWEMVNEGQGASLYSADTNAMWDLALTCTTAITVADEVVVVEAVYTSGD